MASPSLPRHRSTASQLVAVGYSIFSYLRHHIHCRQSLVNCGFDNFMLLFWTHLLTPRPHPLLWVLEKPLSFSMPPILVILWNKNWKSSNIKDLWDSLRSSTLSEGGLKSIKKLPFSFAFRSFEPLLLPTCWSEGKLVDGTWPNSSVKGVYCRIHHLFLYLSRQTVMRSLPRAIWILNVTNDLALLHFHH